MKEILRKINELLQHPLKFISSNQLVNLMAILYSIEKMASALLQAK
jgi:hypothetical protein